MKHEDKIKMFKDVFAPKTGEKILFLIDIPYGNIKDNKKWKELRKMAKEWYNSFKELGTEIGFSTDILEYKSTGLHNSSIPNEIVDAAKKSNLIIAITWFSASAPLILVCFSKNSKTRCASMPQVEKRMEKTAFKADYKEVKKYAVAIKKMLDDAVGAEIIFSTKDKLYIDLRNRIADADTGECTKNGQFTNFPSGEACIAPYEAADDEVGKFGTSKTEGVWPVKYNKELVKFIIKKNRIIDIVGEGKKAKEMRLFFNENVTRKNVAELGIGCNPKAVITGNVLEDEKVGLHIAYGMSSHLGGKVNSDMHLDICYSKGCPVEGTTVFLINIDGSKTEIIKNSNLRYDLLK